MYPVQLNRTWIADTFAEVFVGRVVCEPSELILNSLRKGRISDDRVLRLFVSKIGIKVSNVQHRFLNFPLDSQ